MNANVQRTYQHTRPVFDPFGKPTKNDDGTPKTETVWMTETRGSDGQSSSRPATADEIANGSPTFPTTAATTILPRTFAHTRPKFDDRGRRVKDDQGNDVSETVMLTEERVDSKNTRSRPATAEEIAAWGRAQEEAAAAADAALLAQLEAEEAAAKAADDGV